MFADLLAGFLEQLGSKQCFLFCRVEIPVLTDRLT